VQNVETRETMLSHFWKADADYGKRLVKAVGGDAKRIESLAAALKE